VEIKTLEPLYLRGRARFRWYQRRSGTTLAFHTIAVVAGFLIVLVLPPCQLPCCGTSPLRSGPWAVSNIERSLRRTSLAWIWVNRSDWLLEYQNPRVSPQRLGPRLEPNSIAWAITNEVTGVQPLKARFARKALYSKKVGQGGRAITSRAGNRQLLTTNHFSGSPEMHLCNFT